MNREELELAMGPGARVFLHPSEVEPLTRLAPRARRAIVEIGTAWGASAVLFLKFSKAIVHSIDPFVRDPHSGWQASPATAAACVNHAAERLGFDAGRWRLHIGHSYDVVRGWDEPFDLLFVDGDHSYVAVRKDFEDWFPHLRPGGYLVLHDARRLEGVPDMEYARGWPGPTRLASELAGDARVKLLDEIESLVVWQKAAGK